MFVLATAYDEHALEAFELGVVDYLLKPFSEERVAQCLRRLHQRRHARAVARATVAPTRIVARRKRSLVFLEPHEIWAFEAADRLTFVHTMHGTFDIDLSLAAVEASFGRAFVRVHRNWLVNATHIKELERDGHETKLFVGAGVRGRGQGRAGAGGAGAGRGGARDAADERDGAQAAVEGRRSPRAERRPGRRLGVGPSQRQRRLLVLVVDDRRRGLAPREQRLDDEFLHGGWPLKLCHAPPLCMRGSTPWSP